MIQKMRMIIPTVFLFGIMLLTSLFTISFLTGKAYAQVVPVQLYQSNPQTYSWTLQPNYNAIVSNQDKGKTFTGNKNPFGLELYTCPEMTSGAEKYVHDYCVPKATNQSQGKLWNAAVFPAGDTCNEAQANFDGPWYTADTRTTNGTGKTNAAAGVCAGSVQNQRAAHPFLSATKQFTYNAANCSGSDEVILASRSDPSSSVCSNLVASDVVSNPQNYSQDQRNCLMYVDNNADVTACKNGVCKTHTYYPASLRGAPTPQTYYENICDAFTQGNGVYDVTINAYDLGGSLGQGGVMYGSSSFWLTALDYKPYTISGSVYNDLNKNNVKDGTDSNYAAPPSITASRGTVTTNANGTYTISNLYPGDPVTISYSSLPSGYNMQYPLNGPPPTFQVSVGSVNCSTNGASGATCNAGNITNLNFAITNSFPWVKTVCGDYRDDNGINNLLPSGQVSITTSTSCTSPGLSFTGDTSAIFGNGQASSTNQVVGGATYPEVYVSPNAGGIFSSYSYLSQKAQTAGLTETNLASVCTISNCTLPANLTHGIYIANGDVKLNTYKIPPNQNFVFLINGNLTLNGNINITGNTKTTDFFSASGNIIIPATLGSAAGVTTPNLEGIFSTDRSFILQSNGNCTDTRLNLEGTLIVNAARSGGSLQNARDLCGNNPTNPTLQMTQRLDFILNLPDFVRQQIVTSNEVSP